MIKHVLKIIVPVRAIGWYHHFLAALAAMVYRYSSRHLLVIGVTGTKGKSTTVYILAHLLQQAGFRVGATSTAVFRIGHREWLNATKMTMQGRFRLQRLLHRMVKAGCQIAVVETSSEGIKQFRHIGIAYDMAVFTNLTPEHIESHGSFENYRRAKEQLFLRLSRLPRKSWAQVGVETQQGDIPKVIVANLDDKHGSAFLQFRADRHWGFTLKNQAKGDASVLSTRDVELSPWSSRFTIGTAVFTLPLPGETNVHNALAALTACHALGIPLASLVEALRSLPHVPGRCERIDEGQPFTVIVDYAHEPESTRKLYDMLVRIPHQRILHVTGSAGGGRDTSRQPVLGTIAGELADIVIVTNEDPYDDDPQKIIDAVAEGAHTAGKREGETLFRIRDRREAIRKACDLARENDIVLITGKGSEQAMVVKGNTKIPWDDRVVAREELQKRASRA